MKFTYLMANGKRRLKPVWSVLIGILFSICAPLVFYFVYMATCYKGLIDPIEMFSIMSHSSLLSKMIFLSLIPNYFMLYICAKKEWMYMLYGVFIPTILCCMFATIKLL